MMWKIQTAQMREEIYFTLTSRRLFSDSSKDPETGDAAEDPEAQENYSTLISTSSARARRDVKI